MVVAEDEYVMIHGRYTGWAPKPLVAVDIFRIVDGKLVEHWDVMQEEVPIEKTTTAIQCSLLQALSRLGTQECFSGARE